MAIVVVVGDPAAQVAVQRDAVDQVLEVITVFGHRRGNLLLAIVGSGKTEMVRFPVKDVEAICVAEHQVDEALQVAVEGREAESRQRVAVRRQPVVESRRRQAGGQVETQLDETLPAPHCRQDDAAGQRCRQDVVEQSAQHARRTAGGIAVRRSHR